MWALRLFVVSLCFVYSLSSRDLVFAAAAYHEGPCAAILTFTLTNNRASKSVMCGPPVDRSKSSSRTIMNPVTSFFAVKTPDYCPLVKGPSSLQ